MIFEVHKKDLTNVGDYFCNPSRYFDLKDCVSIDINEIIDSNNFSLILGGGGLLYGDNVSKILNFINKKPKTSILWGAGINSTPAEYRKGIKSNYPSFLTKMSLIGIRDFHNEFIDSYLPCVSCMHDAFDKRYEIKKPVVYYLHKYKTRNLKIPDDVSVMYNDEINIYKVIDFLGSAEKIITNSYHGAYWGMLLNRDVEIIPWSSKFLYFKYPPNIFNSDNKLKNKYEDFLEECRSLNINFHKKVLDRI